MQLTHTPEPPYYAVIFTTILDAYTPAYAEISDRILHLAQEQEGFLGFESARNEIGISISYWENLEAIERWKNHSEHLYAQEKGRSEWYKTYSLRVAKVEKSYRFEKEN